MGELESKPGFLLSRVGAAVALGFKAVLSGFGLRPLEFLILQLLDDGEGVSQQELCRAAGVDSGNMVEFLDTLERLDLARRTRDPGDRRRHVVTITDSGRRTVQAIHAAVAEHDDAFFGPLTGPERTRLAGLLVKLWATTDQAGRRGGPIRRAAG